MGCFCSSIGAHRNLCLLFLTILHVWSFSQIKLVADARVLSREMFETGLVEEAEKILMRARIGSRPPACEMRCGTCGHCEAVQVPAVPQSRKMHSSSMVSTINSRGEDNSNYKPMNWKCKCGDTIFNP